MYGMFVHQAVIDSQETESGISIHYVNEHYDKGPIIFQAKTIVGEGEDIIQIAKKVQRLEYKHYPEVIENLLFP